MTGLEIFFNPSARHVQEERERAHTRVDDADSGAPPFGVDLDRMTVTLPRREPAPESTVDTEPDTAAEASDETGDDPAVPVDDPAEPDDPADA
ncbi:DUF6191 domain-containing protein [Rhodococcus aerolatus]